MITSRLLRFLAVACLAAGLTRASPPTPAPNSIAAEILPLLTAQTAAWNRGDIDGFMQTYAAIDELRFASGDSVTYGWKPTLARYKQRYPDRAAMGTLTFRDLTVTALSADAALVFGHWQLTRAKDTPHGLFTLLVRRTPEGWRIFADHTSAATP